MTDLDEGVRLASVAAAYVEKRQDLTRTTSGLSSLGPYSEPVQQHLARWSDPRTTDMLLFAGVTLVLSVVVSADQGADRPPTAAAYLWAVGLGALMLFRRQAPVTVLLLTALGFFTYYAAGFPAIGVAVPIAAALFNAVEAGRTRAAIATGAAVLVGSSAFRVLTGQSFALVFGYEFVSHLTLIACVIALGHSVRKHRDWVARGRQLSQLIAHHESMHAERRLREERLTLARELHDSIGHSLSVASLYTDVAREAETGSAEARTALDQVRQAVSESMSHLRSTVTLLRSTGERSVTHSLQDLDVVLAAPRAAGYEVTVSVGDGALRASAEVQTALYRVVQEAVTNTLKHSDASRIEVIISTHAGCVTLAVKDDGHGHRYPKNPHGYGLRGMRERVERLDGRLVLTPSASGWCVECRIPEGGR